jgi:hypothetical protein
MPPDIKSDIFKWTIGIRLYTTEDQRSNDPCLVRPGNSAVYFRYRNLSGKTPNTFPELVL